MPDQAELILSAALTLPEPDRFRVLEGLLASLPPPGLWEIDDPAFADELERRSRDTSPGITWE